MEPGARRREGLAPRSVKVFREPNEFILQTAQNARLGSRAPQNGTHRVDMPAIVCGAFSICVFLPLLQRFIGDRLWQHVQ